MKSLKNNDRKDIGMRKALLLTCLVIGSINAMDRQLTLEERVLNKIVKNKISCILGLSCECPTYLGRCRYFHVHINMLIEMDKRALRLQAEKDEAMLRFSNHRLPG